MEADMEAECYWNSGGRVALTLLILWVCVQVASPSSLQSECMFVYTQQPSSALTCSPQAIGWLALVCEVHSHAELQQGFGVVWFEVLVGRAAPVLLNGVDEPLGTNIVTSTLNVSLPLKEELHQLFCQIRLDDGTLLQHSQPLVLNSPTSLPLEPCGPSSLVNTTHMCVYSSTAEAESQAMAVSTGSPPPNTMMLSATFYAVVVVIVVFVLMIITLSIIVVSLYRRKCGHSEVPRPIDDDASIGSSNSYNGQEMNRVASPLPEQQEVVTGRYTREPLSSTDSPLPCSPPRPPKPSNQNAPHPTKQGVVDIYKTLESNGVESGEGHTQGSSPVHNNNRHQGKIRFKVLDSNHVGDYERSPAYQCSSPVVVKTAPTLGNRVENEMCAVAGMEVHVGRDVESVGMEVHVVEGKYRGDYERDPMYMRQLAAKQLLTYQIPPPNEILRWRDDVDSSTCTQGFGSSEVRTDKYRGNYERCETYILPPLKPAVRMNGEMEDGDASGHASSRCRDVLVSKYAGNYERDPIYMHNLLQTSLTDTSSHGYTTLEPTSIQPLQPYAATLTHNSPDCKPLPHKPAGGGQPLPPNCANSADED